MVAMAALTLVPQDAVGQISREEALGLVYPAAEIRAERVFLTEDEQQRAEALAGAPLSTQLVARYVAARGSAVVGRAYVDTHTIRSKRETLLVSLDASGAVIRVDVTAFLEPAEYLAPGVWLEQYRSQRLSDELRLQRAIRPLAGATLTARATNQAVRRILAIDQVLERAGAERP